MSSINPTEVYTTGEAQTLLKISKSTMKRLLKGGIIRANKVGGHYRILGKEILRLVSPRIERAATNIHQAIKGQIKTRLKKW